MKIYDELLKAKVVLRERRVKVINTNLQKYPMSFSNLCWTFSKTKEQDSRY